MSRLAQRLSECQLSFPRVSGDEPYYASVKTLEFAFSPRERG